MMQPDIKQRANGRWKGILSGLGMDGKTLSGKQCPCPMCAGKDRFVFDDKEGRGTYICRQCGAGNGVDLVMNWKAVDFISAKRLIESQIGTAPVIIPKATQDLESQKSAMAALWRRAAALDGLDIASRYLGSRGIPAGSLAALSPSLRWTPSLSHKNDDRVETFHPAMLAKFVAADDSGSILHRTWLAEPGVKANVDKARKLMPGKVPEAGAVRLGGAGETMGIAEGLETALSAGEFFKIPVWAALTAGALIKWKPPKAAKSVIVFGDTDKSFTGQVASYSLAHRLRTEGYQVEVRFTTFYDAGDPEDWNDALKRQAA